MEETNGVPIEELDVTELELEELMSLGKSLLDSLARVREELVKRNDGVDPSLLKLKNTN